MSFSHEGKIKNKGGKICTFNHGISPLRDNIVMDGEEAFELARGHAG